MTKDYVVYGDGHRRTRAAHERKNNARVFIDGHYAGQSHTLGVPPGRYTSDLVRGILDQDYKRLDDIHDHIPGGYIYAVVHASWPGWVKVGMTVDPERRLRGYQTGSPFRDYEMVATKKVADRRLAEWEIHQELAALGRREGEWFQVPLDIVVSRLQ